MFKEENFDKKMSVKFLQTLNRHLPVKRKTLMELLGDDKPEVRNLDGTTHCFEKKELEKLSSLVPEWEHSKLRLPVYLEMSSTMERGNIKISGRIECRIINETKRTFNNNSIHVHDMIILPSTSLSLCISIKQ